jgi:hypothetical protein
MARKTDRQSFASEPPSDPTEELQCAYSSLVHGRCRYWSTIVPFGARKGFCSAHYKTRSGPEAEQIAEASQRWRRHYWDLARGILVDVNGNPTSAVDRTSAAAVGAAAAAERLGVDPGMPHKQRALLVAQEFRRRGGVGAGAAEPILQRVPGEDDE